MKNNNQRLKAGIERMKHNILLILIPVLYVALMVLGMIMLKNLLQEMESPYSGKVFEIVLYVFTAEMIFVGVFGIIQFLGKPFGSKKIEGELLDVGFTDNEGESPMLISRTKDKNGYIFYSPRIPFVRYEDHIAEIETVLNIKIIDVLPGKDKQHTTIRAVNGGKKKLIMWNDNCLSDDDFVLVLGESYFGIESVKEALEQEKEYQRLAGIKCTARVDGFTNFIFVNRFGNVQHQGTLNKALRRIIRDCNQEVLDKAKDNEKVILLPKFSCHTLRHTFTTRLCESGINIKVIQSVLGHSDISTTLDIYADVTKDLKRTEMEHFDDFMKKKKDAI